MYSVWGYRPVTPLSQQGGDDSIIDSILDSTVSSGDDYRFNPASDSKLDLNYFTNFESLRPVYLHYTLHAHAHNDKVNRHNNGKVVVGVVDNRG